MLEERVPVPESAGLRCAAAGARDGVPGGGDGFVGGAGARVDEEDCEAGEGGEGLVWSGGGGGGEGEGGREGEVCEVVVGAVVDGDWKGFFCFCGGGGGLVLRMR